MNPIILKTFKGRVPRVSGRLLAEGYAQTATNCDLRRGRLEPINDYSVIKAFDVSGVHALIRINRDLAVTEDKAWLPIGPPYPNASLVRAQIQNSDNRIYCTAENKDYPVQIDSNLWAEGGGGWKRLGVIPPDKALDYTLRGKPDSGTVEIATFERCSVDITESPYEIIVEGAGSCEFEVGDTVEVSGAENDEDNGTFSLDSWADTILQVDREFYHSYTETLKVTVSRTQKASVAATVSYVYTRVIEWKNSEGEVIQEEESAPSPPGQVYELYEGQAIELSGFSKRNASGDNNGDDVTHYRIYRLEAGSDGAEYQYLASIESSEATYVDDVESDPAAATGHALKDVGDDILETTDWTPPPDGLLGLTQYANGILAGFVGNKLHLSEPWAGYAWPDGYTMVFDYDIVALAVYNESLLVLTEGFPYVVTGTDPESMSQTILPYEQACVSRAGVCVSNVGVIYPSPDGLFLLTASGGKLLTKEVYTKNQWALLGPENLISFFYDDCYYGFFKGTGTGFYFNFKDDPYVVDVEVSGNITGGYLDPENDTLYLVVDDNLVAWGAGAALPYTWKSAVYRPGELANYACAAVVAEGGITFTLYADGELKDTHIHWLDWSSATAYTLGDIVTYSGTQWICIQNHTNIVPSTESPGKLYWSPWGYDIDEMFRLPSGYRARELEFSLEGSVSVDSVAIGQHSGELL
jgi:hypothetical protein